MPNAKKFYACVAFSIAEEGIYLIATKPFKNYADYRNWIIDKLGVFTELRHCPLMGEDRAMLSYSGLQTHTTPARPVTSPNTVLSAFHKLQKYHGFTIDEDSLNCFMIEHPTAKAAA